MRHLLLWPLRRLAYALIPGWVGDGAPDGQRFDLVCWAWAEDDRRAMREAR